MLNAVYKLPRFFLAVVILLLGIAFIVFNDPPHHFCDTQIDYFKSMQQKMLRTLVAKKRATIDKNLFKPCGDQNSPGACYPLFSYLKSFLKELTLVREDCARLLKETKNVKSTLYKSFELISLISWNEEAVRGKIDKYNWLSRLDIDLFCRIKNQLVAFYGLSSLDELEKDVLSRFKTTQALSDKKKREYSVLSIYCPV